MRMFKVFSLATLLLFSCKKGNELFFSKPADLRLNDAVTSLNQSLAGAPFGWKVTLVPQGYDTVSTNLRNGSYNFVMSFDSSTKQVSMLSDLADRFVDSASKTSFRVFASQRISLTFDNFSYIHTLSDPDPSISGGAFGSGYLGDYLFELQSSSADSIVMKGILRKGKLLMVRAKSQEDAKGFISGTRATVSTFQSLRSFPTYWKRLTIGTQLLDVNVSKDFYRIIRASDNQFNYSTSGYNAGPSGKIGLNTPVFSGNSYVLSSINNLAKDASLAKLSFNNDKGESNSIQPAGGPLPGSRFFGPGVITNYTAVNPGIFSEYGIFNSGVSDGFKLGSVTGGFGGLQIYPDGRRVSAPSVDGARFGLQGTFTPTVLGIFNAAGQFIAVYNFIVVGIVNSGAVAFLLVGPYSPVFDVQNTLSSAVDRETVLNNFRQIDYNSNGNKGFYIIAKPDGFDFARIDASVWMNFGGIF